MLVQDGPAKPLLLLLTSTCLPRGSAKDCFVHVLGLPNLMKQQKVALFLIG